MLGYLYKSLFPSQKLLNAMIDTLFLAKAECQACFHASLSAQWL